LDQGVTEPSEHRGDPMVSGALAVNLRGVLYEYCGREVVTAASLRVPADVREEFDGVTSIGWARISTFEQVFSEVASDTGTTVASLHTNVARISIERTMRTVWRVLLRLTTDNALISRAPVIFSRSYDRGKLEARIPTSGRGEITLSEWPDAPEWPIRATRIGIETVLRLAGRRDARVESERRPEGAFLLATWR
jgi:hypothetical protein